MAQQIDKKLPSIADLTKDIDEAFKNDQFNLLMNQQPPQSWVKKHPYVDDHFYLPIERVEFLLKRIFKAYQIDVIKIQQMFDSVVVSVTVKFLHPVSGNWQSHDGVGAISLQTKKGTGPLKPDQSNMSSGAVSMAVPIAESLAIKDACHKIGKLFGADLNRDDNLEYHIDPDLENKTEITDKQWEDLKKAVKSGAMSADRAIDRFRISPAQCVELEELEKQRKNG